MCQGYYNHNKPYQPRWEGMDRFQGLIVHPQHWPEDLDWAGRQVVVIGSGATAVTLVPALARRAAHVTMLQRSPSYVLSLPQTDPVSESLSRRLGPRLGFSLTRWKNVLRMMAFYHASRRFPRQARSILINEVRKIAGDYIDVEAHFSPTYHPWDQRVCFVPDNDLFRALQQGRASVVTDHIVRFTETGVLLRSGATVEADLVAGRRTGLHVPHVAAAGQPHDHQEHAGHHRAHEEPRDAVLRDDARHDLVHRGPRAHGDAHGPGA